MKPKMMSLALGVLSVLVCIPALAALSESEKDYVARLINDDWLSIRSAAQGLSGSSNPDVLDVAAEVLLEKYQHAGVSPDAVDALAWVCRTLGSSNNSRYRPVLELVENDKSVHRKLRRHCETGADSLPRKTENAYIAGTVNLAALRGESPATTGVNRTIANLPALAALSGMEKGYVDQLVNGHWVAIRRAAQGLSGSTNTEVLDIAAEVLLEKYPLAGGSDEAVDAMSWVCRMLGRSDLSRYRPVLEQVQEDESAHRKLRDHCERGTKWLPMKTENGYVPGTVNLAALRGNTASTTAQ